MLIPRIVALALSLTVSTFAAPSVSSSTAAQKKVEVAPGTLVITRVDNEILLTWAHPVAETQIRNQEIVRNETPDTKGRKRLAVIGAGVRTFSDFVPEGSKPFSYWVKVTRPDLTNYNIGPVTAPALADASNPTTATKPAAK